MQLTDFQKVVAMNALSGIGMGLVGIFLPIYLLTLGYSLSTVIFWLLIQHSSLLAAAFLVAFVSNRIGLVRCWHIRVVFVGLLFVGLLMLPHHPALLYLLAVIEGLDAAFFWIPYNIFTVRKTTDGTMGSSLAFMSNVSTAAGILVPGVAALLIVYVGYYALFAVAFVFIVFSIFPVISLRTEKTDFRFSWRAMRETVSANRQFILPEIIDNFGEDAQIVWSLYIFVAGLTILNIGALGVVSSIIGMIGTYLVGKTIDRGSKKKLFRIAAVGTTLLWVFSYVVAVEIPTPIFLYAATILRGFALGTFVSVYSSMIFNRARPSDAQFLVLREVPTILGRVILFIVAIGFATFGHFDLVFLVVAGVSVYFWFNNVDRLLEPASHANRQSFNDN